MSGAYGAANDVDVDLRSLFGSLVRKWPRIVVVALLVTAAAYGVTWLITPLYKAETKVIIEEGESSYTRTNTGVGDDKPTFDEEGVTSQIQLINSTNTLKQVAQNEGLAVDRDQRPRQAGQGRRGEGRRLPRQIRPSDRTEQFRARHAAAVGNIDRAVAG